MSTTLTLNDLNQLPRQEAAQRLLGLYEHSDWIAEQALAERPFLTPAALKLAMIRVLNDAGREAKLALIRAHPELAGKAMVSQTLTTESTSEQSRAGLTHCTPQEFARIQELNAAYNKKFGTDVKLYAPYVYDAVMVMATAMQKADSVEPAKYLPELAKISYKGVTGPIEFDTQIGRAHV